MGEWESWGSGRVGAGRVGWRTWKSRFFVLVPWSGLCQRGRAAICCRMQHMAACPRAVFTAKEEDLWKARDGVGMEDIKHMQSRCDIFRCTGEIVKKKGGVPQCRVCFAKWVRDFASRHDADIALSSHPLPVPIGIVDGLVALLESSRIQGPVRVDLTREVLSLGAVHVRELGRTDWLGLNSWSRLREMEQRRVLAAVGL